MMDDDCNCNSTVRHDWIAESLLAPLCTVLYRWLYRPVLPLNGTADLLCTAVYRSTVPYMTLKKYLEKYLVGQFPPQLDHSCCWLLVPEFLKKGMMYYVTWRQL